MALTAPIANKNKLN